MKEILEKFNSAYQTAPDSRKDVVDSTLIVTFVNDLITARSIDLSQRNKVIVLLSIYVLEGLQISEVATNLTSLGIPNSSTIISNLGKYLDKNFEIREHTDQHETTLNDNTRKNDYPSVEPVSPEPIYTTTQEAILKEGRWETE